MRNRSNALRRYLTRGGPLALVAVFLTTGLALPAAAPKEPVVEAKVHALAEEALRAGQALAVDTDIPTQAVGVDWDGSQEGAVEVRARDGESWGPWQRLEGNPMEGPDDGSKERRDRTSAGPLWVGRGIDKIEVRMVEGDLHGVRLHAIRSEEPPAGRGIRPAGAVLPQPGIVSRAAWGANEADRSFAPGCNGQPEYAATVRNAIVHHTASATNYAASDGPALMRAFYYFHTHTNGWCDIGYNFLVDRYGQVYEGRFGGITQPVIGAHALNFNTGSTGVALIGTFQTDSVPAAMYASLRSLLAWKLAYHGVNPAARVAVSGKVIPTVAAHRDVNATDCPGDLAYGLLPQLRAHLTTDHQISTDKPALARSGLFLLKGWQTSGVADGLVGFGNPTDLPVMGDWDGNGTETPGVFRNGIFYLRNSYTSGVGDIGFGFGDPGDVPVVGDWDGNGTDTPGLFRNGAFYLRNSNTTGRHDVGFGFGDPGDTPVIGDWNGDRIDTPGLFRGGIWLLRNSNTTGRHDLYFGFGDPGDVATAGDWNGDGADTPGLFRRGLWLLRNSNTTGRHDVSFGFGDPGDRPLAWS